MTRDELFKLARAAGLGSHADLVATSAADSVRLTPEPLEQPYFKPGQSRFGGVPDLAPSQIWPSWRGEPLGFVAQIDLAELQSTACKGALPPAGWLSFFYHPAQETWGFDPQDRGSFQVLHSPPGPLVRQRIPEGLPDQGIFEPCRLHLTADLSLPAPDSLPFQATGLARVPPGAFEDLMEVLWGEHGWGSRSRLFGFPDQIQGEMQEECAMAAGGLYCGNADYASDPRAPRLRASAPDWHLLLQVTSHDEASMMWGDLGNIYYWLRAQDLQRGAFDQAWLVLQCS